MILALLVIGAVAFFTSFIYIDKPLPRMFWTVISALIVIGSLIAIVANYHDHFGLEKVTSTSTKKIYSADTSGKMQLVLYEPIGTSGKENVYIYVSKAKSKKLVHTQADEFTENRVKLVNGQIANLKTQETRWEYKPGIYKLLFGIANNGHELTKRINTFRLPKTWLHLSTSQIKVLKKDLTDPAMQAEAKTQASAYVQTHMKAAIAKNSSLATDQAAQAKLSKRFAAEFQAQLIQKILAK
ncbi:DUF4811 domain-containing protein [Oenococcus sicerae]|uniref:DUF4811 domain-containing protein n=1 Tax=Oenococcus sicerae TaxID=2203724 RepID=A0ABX5QM94_9LACO|nr:DUF4811 domain-containing protein [Oenococcus sicerae]QAS69850.1 DUF4811 domain-containing protein [Oenococcus sicerae]